MSENLSELLIEILDVIGDNSAAHSDAASITNKLIRYSKELEHAANIARSLENSDIESKTESKSTKKSFAEDFNTAFTKLDAGSGGNNYVLLLDLRTALSGYSRQQFDAGLQQLRRTQQFTLDASEGRHGRLDEGAMAAGIVENGHVLVYAARK